MDNLTEQLMKYSCKDCDSSGCCAWKQRVVDGDKYCQRPKTFAEDMLRIFESNNYIQLHADEKGLIDIGIIGDICNLDIPKNPTEYGQQLKLMNICSKIAKAQKALSANNEKWEEKIKVIHSNIQKRLENGGSPIVVLATVKADIDSLLSQMKEGK